MGTANSRGMELGDELTDQEDGDVAQLLQYLIHSGQVHIIAPDDSDDSDDFDSSAISCSSPRIYPKPNLAHLENTHFQRITQRSTGMIPLGPRCNRKRPASVANFLSDRQRGVAGVASERCQLLNQYIPNKKTELASYRCKLFCCSFTQSGDKLLVAGQDRQLRIFDTTTSRLVPRHTIPGQNVGWSILDAAFSPCGNSVIYASWCESVHLCRLYGDTHQQETLVISPHGGRFSVFSLKYSSDGREILCGANDGCMYIYDLGCDKSILKVFSHDDDVNSVGFTDDTSQIVFSGGDDGIVKVWDKRTLSESHPSPVGMLAGHMDGVIYVEPRGDGRHLLSNSKDQSIKLWDLRVFSSQEALDRTKTCVAEQMWDYRWQGIPKFLRNPSKRVAGDTSLMTYCGHTVLQTLMRAHFSPLATTGQRFIYAGCSSGRLIIYDTLTGEIAKELKGHRGCVRDAAWHPYRPEIISTSWDGSIQQWEYSDGDEDDDLRLSRRLQQPPLRRSQRLIDRMKRRRAEMEVVSDW